MWKLHEQRLVGVVVSCGAALALVAACSSDSTSGDGTGGSSGSVGSGNASGTSSGGKSGATSGGTSSSSGGTSSGGTSSGGTSSGGTPSGGAANGGGGSSAGGAASGGGGATNGGGAGKGGSGGATGGAAAAGEAGAGEAGAGDAGAPGFTPLEITLLNSGFETGDNFVPGTVKDWQTSGDLASYITYTGARTGYGRLAMWRQTPAYKVSTFQTVNGLTNGTYTLAAWVEGAATGINSLYIYATGYSSTATDQVKTDIVPGATAYAQYSLTNIQVTTGTLTVGVYTDATADTWVNVDDVTLFRVE